MVEKQDIPIPKILHYCWFGQKKMDNIHKRCLKSWKKNLPGFKIMRWDETNIDISENPFLESAFTLRKWAFVSDYIRLKKLYEYGGIYLDTDMLLLKPLNEILTQKTFFGAENSKFINAAVIGTQHKNHFIKRCLLKYDKVIVNENTNFAQISIPQIITSEFRSVFNYQGDFSKIVNESGILIFPPSYFYSLPYRERHTVNKKKYVSEDSFGLHLWDESWKELSEFSYLRKGQYLKGFKRIFKNKGSDGIFKYFKKIIGAIIKSRF
ncbi:glycosyltransferase family 32 protein [Salegentibacter maritimus]|uniref:glycosyltransferase family 32 protein n=1 Tax=Salegentibacter maritimus TaxID=2794347 RepID=UPI0018E48EBA|nr:glycosyltransferase [Salegentibacter maritimus]MBI6116720.1 hypothetical protein [Salegentibacter maritimus]